MKRRQLISAASALAASAALSVRAQTTAKVAYGYTAVSDFASVFVAAEEGYFKQHGLDVELKFIPLNSAIPAAIQSDSLQIGGPTPTVFLQSVDGGLDHVVLAGGGVLSKTYTDLAAVARAGRDIGYCHLEKLHNLECLPATGFYISCFPHKVRRASAGWTRAVAIFDERLTAGA